MTDELVPVLIPCPTGAHEEGDTVLLRPRLPLPGGIEARRKIAELQDGADGDEVTGLLMDVYLRHGIADWTLHDDEGNAVLLTRQTLRERILEADLDVAIQIANKADDLYAPTVVAPLVKRAVKSLQASRRGRSTSASTTSTPSRPKRSKPSSTSTTPMAATATTTA